MDKEEFTGEKLKFLRKKYGLKQKDIAEGLKVAKTKISEWENGRYGRISNAYQQLLTLFFEKLEKKD